MPYSQVILNRRQRRRRWLNTRMAWVLQTARWFRANSRDTLALVREFRSPLVVLSVVLIGGTPLYGVVHLAVTGERIPLASVPYLLLSLMLFQQPEGIDLPSALPLMLFWYAMPLVGLYVLAQGVTESARLFFNRSARINEWTEAVAATYRRHLILVGLGQLGERVIEAFSAAGLGYNLIVINTEITPQRRSWLESHGVIGIAGDARENETLLRANVSEAAAIVVCTSEDDVNFEVIMSARDLNPDIRIVARVWADEAAARLRKFFQVDATYSASSIVTPAYAGSAIGIEIAQIFQIGQEDYSLIRLEVSAGSIFDGRTVRELQNGLNVSIVMVKSDDKPEFSPPDDRALRGGDSIMVFAEYGTLVDLIAANDAYNERDVIVVGVGHVGERVTNLLVSMGCEVTVIDTRMTLDKRHRLTALGCRTIVGDGSDPLIMEDAEIHGAEAVVVCTDNDRMNFDICRLTRDLNPNTRLVTRIHDLRLAEQMERYLSVNDAISAASAAAPAFVGAATGSFVAQSFQFGGREYSTVRVRASRRFVGRTIDDLETSLSIDVIILEQDGTVHVSPDVNAVVAPGDVLVIFGIHSTLENILV